MLSPKLLDILRSYWKVAHPKEWLFPGRYPGQPITRHSVELACQMAHRLTGFSKPVTPHSLRHAFAVHLLESGSDVRTFNCCLVIAVWPPRPDICGSRPVKSVLRPARWICSHARFLLRQSPCRRNISEHRSDATLWVGSGGCLPPPW